MLLFRQTTNNDHTPLSLACAGGHLAVVELLLLHGANPFHRLKDNSTMIIEAAKSGHTQVVQLLLDYPNSILVTSELAQISSGMNVAVPSVGSEDTGSGTPATCEVPTPAPRVPPVGGVVAPAGPVPSACTQHGRPDPQGVVSSSSSSSSSMSTATTALTSLLPANNNLPAS